MSGAPEAGRLVPRALYRISYREALQAMILDAMVMGVQIPDDMPVDTPEHVKMAIVCMGRLTRR